MRKNSPYLVGLAFVLIIVAALVFPFAGGAAPGVPTKSPVNANAITLPDYDAFGASTKRSAAIAQSDQSSLQTQAEGGHLVQSEPRLGVPTFLWVSNSGSGGSTVRLSAQNGASDVARDYLSRYASRYRLSNQDVLDAQVAGVHDTGKGAIIVKYKQDIGGVEVFRDSINVIMNRQYELIALSGYLTSKNEGAGVTTQDFSLSKSDALAKALEDLTGGSVSASSLRTVTSESGELNPYSLFTADQNETRNFSMVDEPARVKKVFYHLVDEYVPAYYVEADVYVPTTSGTTLSAVTGSYVPEERAYSYVISATDGQVLFRHNLIAEQKVKQQEPQPSSLGPGGFTYRVWADPVTGLPYDTPAGNSVHPKVVATNDGAQFPFVSLQNVQLPNFPFSQNDPWLAPGATSTSGNNVEAFTNLVNAAGNADNGFGPAQEPPVDPPTGDHHAFTTAVDSFIFNHQPDVDAFSATARQGAITQLFYDVNFLHDWFYDAGFTEASGNAQTNNFGRGGLGNDNIKGQVEDTASFSNANMLTPADGGRPRMRMYNFPNISNTLDIQAPAGIAGKISLGISQTGLRNFDINNDIVIATFSNSPSACTITNAAAISGKIAMFDFDNTDGTGCSFSTRITRIHASSALAALMVYTSASPNAVANITGIVATHTKPIGVISWNNGQAIKGVIGGNTVTARLLRVADRDGSLDAQILFHEWGHYISNRLIGNGNGLNANYAGGLGEGWGDFTAMMLTVREQDTSTASNATWNGTYALATYATSGVPFNGSQNNGYYFGIRRYPYSTDMLKNPLTFKHIQDGIALPVGPPVAFGASGATNSEVHNTGEVWSMMLWECYASLLRDTLGSNPRLTFQEAQDRMKNYVVAAYKMTPLTPTLLEARDAVLAAAFANDYNDGVLFAQAFAKRGAGYGAISPDRFSSNNSTVTESFVVASALTYVGGSLDDTVDGCDNDGYLDHNEKGLLNVTLKNNGNQNLFNTTATVSTTNPNISFPDGATITFPPSQPGQSVTGSVTVAANNSIAGISPTDFTINFEDNPTVTVATAHFFENVNVDEIPSSTATDTLEAKPTTWVVTNSNAAGLYTNPAFKWVRTQQAGMVNRVWSVPDAYVGTDELLTSPVFTQDGSGSFNIQFDHSFGFEFDAGGNYDGGVVEYSVNGGAFTNMGVGGGLPNYNGTILNYSGDVNPLKGQIGFVQNSGGTIHSSFTKAIAPGSTVQIRFRAGSDSSVGAAGWVVDNVAFTGVVETPFNTLVGDSKSCHPDPGPTPVVISMSPSAAPAGAVGDPYSLTVTATGGSGSYTYSTTPVVLPPGLSGNTVGGSFQLTGTPTHAGTYLLTVKADDGAAHLGSINYTIVIDKGTPTITWSNPADITYPTPLSGTQLNAIASVPGVLTYTPPSGTVLNAGNAQTLSVNFVPNDPVNYNDTSKNVSINVLKATPTITWNNPADIEYGTLLSATQLNASASVAGTLTYTPPAGNLLNVGSGQTLSVNFVPADTTNYNNASKNVLINVTKATPTITWNDPADITYPTALSGTQLNAVTSVPGVLTYTPPSGTVLNAGNAQTLSVNFVPTDTANYNNASKNVSINVLKATPTITWNNPSDITYPTALGATQLNAIASVPGVLTYTPPSGTVLNAGSAQTLSVNFVPTDTTNYNNASKNVSINVLKATPTITWSNPADITYPTALSGTELNAVASVPGVLTYTPPSGTVLNAGSGQTLSVNFVPTDTTNYNNASKNVSINVLKATPTITWSNPADITYLTALSGTQLNAVASVPGVLTYTPPSGTVLNAGNGQILSVNFVPTDTTNYNNASKNVSINVLKATPTITWNNPADITYPAALSNTQLNASTSVVGTFNYSPGPGTILNAGNAQTLSVTFVPTDTSNYNNATKNVAINVLKANQTISFGPLSNRPLSSATFNVSGTASSNLPLTFTIFSGPATINAGVVSLTGIGQVTVRASQPGDGNYNAATPVDQTFTVTPAINGVAVSSSLNPSVLGQAVTFTATVTSESGIPTGTVTFKDAANTLGNGTLNGFGQATLTTSALSIGTHAITADYSGDANNLGASGSLPGGQLVNSPPNGVIQFSGANYSVVETGESIAITITRTGDTSAAATVDYATEDGSNPSVLVPCSTTNGLARERCDFTRATGTVHFEAGQASQNFTVLVSDDSYIEGAETLQLILSNASTGSQLGAQTTATLTINDDDIVPSGNPVDNANTFVESLYHDFLNRTPDSAGRIFWTNEITSCGSNQVCVEQKRVNVAAAFFLSIEFQQTGYLIERLYKTSYGDAQGSSTTGGQHLLPVPVVRLNEFLPDTQKVGAGVFVGQPGWETALENNKVAFINEFVLRSRFATAFPGSMTNAVFVDALNANAGNPLTTAERNQLVADLNNAVKTRAQVVRVVAEHPALVTAESNRAFVLMQYFGFLRRNPNDAPDTDYTGYEFWLSKLNQFNGNAVDAEMVKAFINSQEYRQRFGN